MKVLIVGGGLAGCCIAHHLLKENVTVRIIDSGANHSSKVAAGMINPIVFRRMLKSWLADDLIPYLETFYREMEKEVNASFLIKRKIKRVFSSLEEKEMWDKRKETGEYDHFLLEKVNSEDEPSHVISKFGSAYVASPGYIDSPTFIKANHAYFSENNILDLEEFDYSNLDVESGNYKGENYDSVIFSEGYRGKNNPYFGYLPLNQTKGEVLTLKADSLPNNEILNRKCFVLPTINNTVKVGATFAWHTTDLSITRKAKGELLNHYNNLTTAPYALVDQEAGIRPTVVDRRPLLGKHPKLDKLYIFNGLGTKGYMLAPYFAHHLVEHILHQKALMEEVDIQRFEKKYYNSTNKQEL